MTTETRAGFPTAFARFGDGPRKALFLHCSLASHRAWLPVIERLDPAFTITAPDFPGHGRSGDWSPEAGDFFELSTRIAESFPDGPVDVVGHSFGGAVALRLAVERPDLVRRMVLVEPVFFAAARGTPAHVRHREMFAPFRAALDHGDRAKATRVFAGMWGGDTAFEDLPGAQREAMIARIHLVAASAPGIEDDNADLLRGERLEGAGAPTLLVAGTRTADVVREIHATLSARMPDAQETVIDGAGHMAPLSHPDAVASLIRDHLGA